MVYKPTNITGGPHPVEACQNADVGKKTDISSTQMLI